MEFHIPYYAVRHGSIAIDGRMLHSERLRRSTILPLSRGEHIENFTYHEVKISGLITGVDDYLWTSYTFCDTYFGQSENLKSSYLKWNNNEGLDPATGGSRTLKNPYWNPRDYFLSTVAKRIGQVVKEWRNLVVIFDHRMQHYVRGLYKILYTSF